MRKLKRRHFIILLVATTQLKDTYAALKDKIQIAIVNTGPINVKAFGAKGDGVTDDGAALQKAFNYAKAHKKPVYIPSGTYKFSRQLTVDSISVYGDRTNTLLVPTDRNGGDVIVTGTNPSLRSMAFEGNKATRSSGYGIRTKNSPTGLSFSDLVVNGYPGRGIEINNVASGVVHKCKVTNCTQQAITANFSYKLSFTYCEISNCHHGIQIWGGDANPANFPAHRTGAGKITISNCVVNNPRYNARFQSGFWASLTNGITITNCVVTTCSDVGLDVEGCKNVLIANNAAKNCTNGCLTTFYSGDNVVFSNNSCSQGKGFGPGIKVYSGSKLFLYRSVFKNNRVKTYDSSGFYSDDNTLNNVKIQDNNFVQSATNSTNPGIRLVGGVNVSVLNNYIEVCQTKGISYKGLINGKIKDNTIVCENK